MQFFTLLTTAALATLAVAQDASDLPQCSLPCFIQYVPETGCDLTDYVCQCTTAHQAQISDQITQCVLKDCTNIQDALKTQTVAQQICAKYGGGASSSAGTGNSSAPMATGGMTGATPSSSMFTPVGTPAATFTGGAGFGTAHGATGGQMGILGGAVIGGLMWLGL